MKHDFDTKYTIAVTTKEMATTGHMRITYVTLGHDVIAVDETIRVDLADHPLYKQLQEYVKSNPR